MSRIIDAGIILLVLCILYCADRKITKLEDRLTRLERKIIWK